MKPLAILLTALALAVMLAFEILLARLHANILAAPLLGLCMAGLVAITFMRLSATTGLPRVFALAATFWLIVLLGMGSMDALTRHDVPVSPAVDQP